MADPRKSVAIALETGEFGKGNVAANSAGKGIFYSLPPGTWCSHSNEFRTESVYATGSKLRETATYGPFSGSWNIHFIMDYEHTEFLDLVFENHTVSSAVSGVTTDDGAAVYDHTWTKNNANFIKPFVIREKLLNRIANSVNESALDEVILLKGCLVKSIEFNRTQQGSQMEVRMSGLFADMEVQLAELTATDYTVYDNTVGPSQYSCMFLDQEDQDNYVRDVDSHSVKLSMDTSLVYNGCSPFATTYFEGQSHISWDAKTFANDPEKKFQLRPFSGGKDAAHLKPMAKNLQPMEHVFFTTYNLSMRDDGYTSITNAIDASPYIIRFVLDDSTVNAMSWPDGEGEKITDSLQSVECSQLTLTVRNTHSSTAWVNTIVNNGVGEDFTPLATGTTFTVAKYRPSISVNDADVNAESTAYTMADGEYITVKSTDLNRGKILKEATVNSGFNSTNGYNIIEGWVVVPYNSGLYDVPSGGDATLMDLLDLTSSSAASLINSGLTLTPDWTVLRETSVTTETTTSEQTTTTQENVLSTTVLGYYPRITISGTPDTAGTYKYYIIKCHLEDDADGDGKTLFVEDRGILRIDVASSS